MAAEEASKLIFLMGEITTYLAVNTISLPLSMNGIHGVLHTISYDSPFLFQKFWLLNLSLA